MLILVSGGAASGKSEFAEGLAVGGPGPHTYAATMLAWGEEGAARVARHRVLRAGKGFNTMECPENLAEASIPQGGTVLLEDLSNLTANEWFGACGPEGAFDRVLTGVLHLAERASRVVVVANELYADGISYGGETEAYLACLSALSRTLASQADGVYEVVCGIPICHKGEWL